MADKVYFGLKMKQLPKPEYRLMRTMQSRYSLNDPSELFAVCLRLMHEVSRYTDVGGKDIGQQWIISVIDSLRSTPEEQRNYEE